MKDGRGTYKWKSGARYHGRFKDDLICGRGVLTNQRGRYEGDFLADKKHGMGVFYYANGIALQLQM